MATFKPLPAESGHVDAAYVTRRLEEAGKTLLALRTAGKRPPTPLPEVAGALSKALEGIRPKYLVAIHAPSAAAIAEMDEAFGWISLVGVKSAVGTRRLLWMRLVIDPTSGKHIWSWRKLGKVFHGMNHETLKARHGRGIDRIVTRLTRADFDEKSAVRLP